MNEPIIEDGLHRHHLDEKNCFFCIQNTKNWKLFKLQDGPGLHPRLKKYLTHRFVICSSCWAKGIEYVADQIIEHLKVEEGIITSFSQLSPESQKRFGKQVKRLVAPKKKRSKRKKGKRKK